MKSQDVLLLMKLISLQKQEKRLLTQVSSDLAWPVSWRDWDNESMPDDDTILPEESYEVSDYIASLYTTRSLEVATGISKSQVSLSLNRCSSIGLLRKDRKTGIPRTNIRALQEFILYGLKYIFPAKPDKVTRGIATAFAAPVLNKKLMSAGELVPVWPDARGNSMGQAVKPLCTSVVDAVRKDPELYALLALVDAIRIGQPREANLATELLKKHMEVN